MGEEQAGVDAVRIAFERIRAGQGDAFLVGGSYNAERADALLIYAMGGFLRHAPFAPVDQRADDPGLYLGSGGAFLVLEARETAEARGASILAVLKGVDSRRSRRVPGSVGAALGEAFKALPAASGRVAVMSGATGIAGITNEEIAALPAVPVRFTASRLGHMTEAQFPAGIALAVESLRSGALPAPAAGSSETEAEGEPEAIYVTSVGHMRGEGLALVVRAH